MNEGDQDERVLPAPVELHEDARRQDGDETFAVPHDAASSRREEESSAATEASKQGGPARKGVPARRQGRVMAMQALFEIDAVAQGANASIAALAAEHDAADQAVRFATALVAGTLARLSEIDALIATLAPQFPLDQLAAVDRAVLRVAVYELRYGAKAPPKAVVNEAIEIAKEYGGDASGRFVNGVLGRVLTEFPPPRAATEES